MSKSRKIIIKSILAVAIFIIVSAFLNMNIVYASDVVLTVIVEDKTYNFNAYEISTINGKKTLKKASDVVEGIYLDTLINPTNASLSFTGNKDKPFKIVKEKVGKSIQKELLLNEINDALNSSKNKVIARLYDVIPAITCENLSLETNKRASFTTYFNSSNENRIFNISKASNSINGIKILPNQEFSFNEVVGVRSEENGYKTAKIILNGEYSEGVGGGVCQVSTTLYNCALISGLKITEYHRHSLNVGYIEPSFDAMVNSYTSDLKFVNNTGKNVYVLSFMGENSITFSIYGEKQLESYERVSVIKEEIIPEDLEFIKDDTLLFGQTKILQEPKSGIVSEGYLIKYVNGERVSNCLLRKDTYKSVRGKTLIGMNKDN